MIKANGKTSHMKTVVLAASQAKYIWTSLEVTM